MHCIAIKSNDAIHQPAEFSSEGFCSSPLENSTTVLHAQCFLSDQINYNARLHLVESPAARFCRLHLCATYCHRPTLLRCNHPVTAGGRHLQQFVRRLMNPPGPADSGDRFDCRKVRPVRCRLPRNRNSGVLLNCPVRLRRTPKFSGPRKTTLTQKRPRSRGQLQRLVQDGSPDEPHATGAAS